MILGIFRHHYRTLFGVNGWIYLPPYGASNAFSGFIDCPLIMGRVISNSDGPMIFGCPQALLVGGISMIMMMNDDLTWIEQCTCCVVVCKRDVDQM